MAIFTNPEAGTSTVTVACKIPQGFVCELHEMREFDEVALGHTRRVKQWFGTGEKVVLRGPGFYQHIGPRGPAASGFALTHGVPKDFWDLWIEQNKRNPVVMGGFIFAHSDVASVRAEAKEKSGLKTGLERIDPNNMPPDFKGRVEMAEEQPVKPDMNEFPGA